MTEFNVQVLFESTRAVLNALLEGRAPDDDADMSYEQQHDMLQVALWDLKTDEAEQLSDAIYDLRTGIRDVHDGLRPNPELSAAVEARLSTAIELRQQIAERLRGLRPELASLQRVDELLDADKSSDDPFTGNVRAQLEFVNSLVGHVASELASLRVAELGIPKASQQLLALMERAVELLATEK